ncbi:hypothetical protein KY321_03085 [Candidatus Woesearchaeota archaeon]|nr:hypothetical protein [Candidatus Woesearchaeota archaeon]
MDEIPHKLVMAIVMILVLIIAFGLFAQYKNKTSDAVINEKCEKSVATYSQLSKRGIPVKTDQIHCPVKKTKLSSNENKDKREMAEAMAQCWNNFGKGQLNLFSGEGLFCSVCNIFGSKEEIGINNFETYLQNNVVKGTDKTYLSYIAEKTLFTEGEADDLKDYDPTKIKQLPKSTITLSDSEPYGVIFISAKGKFAKQYLKSLEDNAGVGAVIIGVGIVTTKVGAASTAIPVVGTVAGPVIMIAGGVTSLGGIIYTTVKTFFSENTEIYNEVVLRPYTNETLINDLGCTHIPVSLIDE